MTTRTLSKWKFIGTDGSKGFKHGEVYKLEVTVNHDPSDFFVHVNPHTDFLSIKSWNQDDTFYGSHEAFDSNWEHQS